MFYVPMIARVCLTALVVASCAASAYAARASSKAVISPSIADVAYGTASRQMLDVYAPEDAHNAPIIVMVHGGGWAMGSKSSRNVVNNKVRHWLPKGYIFVSVGYRLIPDANPLEQADDVANALATVQAKAAKWGGDPSRIVLMGHSAGGHLVALISADRSIADKAGVKPWLATISIDSAALNVATVMNRGRPELYENAFGDDPAFWAKASPTLRLTSAVPPMLMVCSSLRQMTCNQAREFAEKADGDVEVMPIALRHMPINTELGADNDYTKGVDAFLNKLGLP
jgi:acetyl esterase/lipase